MKRVMSAGRVSCLLLLALSPLLMAAAHSQTGKQTFHIEGAIEKSGEWSVDRLSKEFTGEIKNVFYTLKGEKGEAKCVPLLAFVQAAKPRLNAKVKNHPLSFAIIIRAKDGYTVTFGLGELMPAYGKREVWLALDQNGKSLPDKETPVSLIVPEDEKPSRWVHGISRITILDGYQNGPQKGK